MGRRAKQIIPPRKEPLELVIELMLRLYMVLMIIIVFVAILIILYHEMEVMKHAKIFM